MTIEEMFRLPATKKATNPTVTTENYDADPRQAKSDPDENEARRNIGPLLRMNPQLLGVNELEISGEDCHGASMPHLRSPRLMYQEQGVETKSQESLFKFSPRRPRKRQTRAQTTPMLETVTKICSREALNRSTPTSQSMKQKEDSHIPTYNVVILGELSVGKSALCRTFLRLGACDETDAESTSGNPAKSFEEGNEHERTECHHVYEKEHTLTGHLVRVRILDINTAKQRAEYGDCCYFESSLNTADAYVLAYSVIDRGTFKTVTEILSHMHTFHPEKLRSLPVVLVGNKCDLVRRRRVTTNSGAKLATSYGVKFIETSASLNENVTTLFEGVIQQIRLRKRQKTNEKKIARRFELGSLTKVLRRKGSPVKRGKSCNDFSVL